MRIATTRHPPPPGRRSMLDLAQNVAVDRLSADIPGERTAVMSEGASLTYSEFVGAVNHIAEVLHARGIERDECVAVIVPRSAELVVAIHGIMRAGAAYVPIDPDYPALRIRTIIEESGARVLVAGTEYAELADKLGLIRVQPSTAGADPVTPSPCHTTWLTSYTRRDHRPAKGCGSRASVGSEPTGVDAAAVRTWPRRRDPAKDAGDIRCLCMGVDVVGDGGR